MDKRLAECIDRFAKNPGAERSVIDRAVAELGITPPPDYLEVLEQMDGGEGFVGSRYLRLYPVERLGELNRAFGVAEFAPGLIVFGSSGGGDAFAFDARTAATSIIQVPFIPLDLEWGICCGATLGDLVSHLQAEASGDAHARLPNPELIGREIHERQPVVFGGDPVDPRNKVALSPEDYARLVVWWNRQYRAHMARRRG